jgi:hypothetical protein
MSTEFNPSSLPPYLSVTPEERRKMRIALEERAASSASTREWGEDGLEIWWKPDKFPDKPDIGDRVPLGKALFAVTRAFMNFHNDSVLRLLATILEFLGPTCPYARPLFEVVAGETYPDAEDVLNRLGDIPNRGLGGFLANALAKKIESEEENGVIGLVPDESISTGRFDWSNPISPRLSAQFSCRAGLALGYEDESGSTGLQGEGAVSPRCANG